MTDSSSQVDALRLIRLSGDEFSALVEPHRRELRVHCYRMMGSLQDAEDMVQEVFLRAWQRRETYAGRATLRAWLYKIATNTCLDTLKLRQRRMIPLTRAAALTLDEPIPVGVTDPIWLEPYPDDWLIADDHTPERYLSTREHISLAFIAALHLLPPRQRAILILRDVLELQASEVAAFLEISVAAVKSALHRARTTLAQRADAANAGHGVATQALLDDYVRAWETADVDLLMRLLKDDATFSMPPIPSWYQGRATIGGLVGKTIFAGDARGRWRLLPARANGQQAFGLYRLSEGGYAAYGVTVLTADNNGIRDIITFRVPELVGMFNLPQSLPASHISSTIQHGVVV
jgi:RNA polymerase sigma-70 factor, ECF subfamily